jgi:hypothetical protein
MTLRFDLSEFGDLIGHLGDAADGAQENLRAAIEVTARNVKDSWNQSLYSDGHAKRTSRAIDYDIEISAASRLSGISLGGDQIVADIGARRGSGKQAGVVRLLENGSVNNPAAGYGNAALNEHTPNFEEHVARALNDAANGAGL